MMLENSIYKMDVVDFLNEIDDNSVDLIVADPPYNIKIDTWDSFGTETNYYQWLDSWLELAVRKLNENGSIYLFNNAYNSAYILLKLKELGLKYRNWIIWYKKDGFSPSKRRFVNNQETILFFTKSDKYSFNSEEIRVPYNSTERIKAAAEKGILKNGKRWFPNPNGKLCTDVWEIPSERLTHKVNGKTVKSAHPTPKPEELIKRIVQASSRENDLILDLFSGTGTTSFVAKQLNRRFLACENNETYIEIIKNRLKI